MFAFKKTVSAFLFPVPLSGLLLIAGLLFLWFTKRDRAGRVLVTLGTLLILVLGYGPISNRLLMRLEYTHPPLTEKKEGIRWVVVLGGGCSCDESLPVGSRLSGASLFRLTEGIRLLREHPESKLLLSGGGPGSAKSAEAMADVARALGVPEERLALEAESWDTEHEARIVGNMVQDDPFILVTSAAHMVRAMALFEKEGMHPYPAPAEYLVKARECERIAPELPSDRGLEKATVAFYEYMGLIWLRLKGD